MTRLQRFWVRNTRCRVDFCKVDWVYHQMTGTRRCLHCESLMVQPPGSCLVGDLNPSVGD